MSAHRTASSPVRSDDADAMRRSQMLDAIVSGQAQIARQQEQIRAMTDENEQLKKEIVHVSGTQYDYVKADKLATLQGDVDALERRYQFEKMRKNDLTKRYQLARIDLLQSRRMKGGVNVEKEQAEAVQRQVDILENRLDQALGKFNDALSFNKELRERIDIIREERRVFQRVHRRMEDDLRAKKLLMAERIEQSNKDMDERDGYVRQAEQLQAALVEQQREYTEQLRAMDAAMVDIKTMREEQADMQLELEAREYEFESQLANRSFAATTTATTTTTTTTAAGGGMPNTASTAHGSHARTSSTADATLTGSSALAATVAGSTTTTTTAVPHGGGGGTRLPRTLSRRANELGDDLVYNGNAGFAYHDDSDTSTTTTTTTMMNAHALDGEHESHSMGAVVARIRDALHSDDLDALLREYETLGDGNFSLYKYLNELTVTRASLADQMRDLQQLLQEEHDSDARQRRLIKSLEEQLAHTERQLAEVQRSTAAYEQMLADVMRLTRDVYKRIGCTRTTATLSGTDEDDDDDGDGGDSGEGAATRVCSEATLMAYLGAIEERANHVVCAYLQWQQRQQQQQQQQGTTTQQQQSRYAQRGAGGRGALAAATSSTASTPPYNDDGNASRPSVAASVTQTSVRGSKASEDKTGHPFAAAAAADDNDDDNKDDEVVKSARSRDGDSDAAASQSSSSNSARGTLPPELSADNMDVDVIPLLPLAPRMVHNAVSAQRLVRLADLPSASLGANETGNALLGGERDDDHVISHDEIRRQLEARYHASREQQQQQQQQQQQSSSTTTRRRHNRDGVGSNNSSHAHGGGGGGSGAAMPAAAAVARPRLSASVLPRTR